MVYFLTYLIIDIIYREIWKNRKEDLKIPEHIIIYICSECGCTAALSLVCL